MTPVDPEKECLWLIEACRMNGEPLPKVVQFCPVVADSDVLGEPVEIQPAVVFDVLDDGTLRRREND